MRKFSKEYWVLLVGIALFAMTLLGGTYYGQSATTATTPVFEGPYFVNRVVDGDTIEVLSDGKRLKVRLLCVDAPESVHPNSALNTEEGKRSSEFTKCALEGRWVLLEFEGKKKEDKYGRVLAYIHINYNVELVKAGHAKYYTKYGISKRYDQAFREAGK